MSFKKAIKSLAMGAVLAGVATVAIKMREEKNRKKAKEMADRAHLMSTKVMKRAQKMGNLTKTSFHKLVDAAVNEYRGVKDVSQEEIEGLRNEIKDSWSDIQRIIHGDECLKAKKKK
jgi:hypothetical protein